MAEHDESIGELKSGQKSQEKRLDGLDTRVTKLNDKVDARHEENNRQYRKIVWGILATILTSLVGQNVVDMIMKGMGKS